jgi:hypothetical protein
MTIDPARIRESRAQKLNESPDNPFILRYSGQHH